MLFSVILPTRNSEWCLPYSLKALLDQVVQPDEYVVCIGKSEDNTEKLILEFQKQVKVPVKLCYDREGIGTGYAMNQIVSIASGDVLLWASSDGLKSTRWVERMEKIFNDNPNISYLCNSGISKSPDQISKLNPDDIPFSGKIKYINGADSLAGLLAFKKKDVIDIGNFDPLFKRGQDFDVTVRLVLSGKYGANCGPQGYHFGVFGKQNIKKGLITGTFHKFLYKYGWRYCLISPHHFAGIVLRTGFLLSLIMLIITLPFSLTLATIFGSTTLLFILGLCVGIIISHKTLSLNLLVFQFIESIGEIYQTYLFMKVKNKPPMRYGLKWKK
jgi:glycosyltransferase involved in cell wall biosynthesis